MVMYGCESWTVKKAEHQRMDAFELWCWRRLLRVPWAARRANQSTQKEIISKYSLEGLMLKLKLQYLGYLMWRVNSLEKMMINIEGRGRRRWQRTRWLNGITDSMDMSLSELLEMVKDGEAWHASFHGVTKNLMWLSDSTGKKCPLVMEVRSPKYVSLLWNQTVGWLPLLLEALSNNPLSFHFQLVKL